MTLTRFFNRFKLVFLIPAIFWLGGHWTLSLLYLSNPTVQIFLFLITGLVKINFGIYLRLINYLSIFLSL